MRFVLLFSLLLAGPVAAQAGHEGHDHDAPTTTVDVREGDGHLGFGSENHAFGSVREGETAETVFRFTNTGTEPVTLTEVRASCGCTTPRYTTEPVAPGATGEIAVAYNSTGRPGPFDKTVTVVADGASPRVTTLRITGTVAADFATSGVRQGALAFDADVWDLAEVPTGESAQHAFRFQNAGTAPIRIRAVTPAAAGVEVVFPDRPIFAQDVAAIVVTVTDPAAVASANGRFQVGISVETTDTDRPTKSLLLRGRVATGG